MREFGWFVIIAGAVIFEVATAPATGFTGNAWRLSRSGSPNSVNLTLERSRHGSRSINGTTVPISRFRGFSTAMLEHSGPAKFDYVSDVGTVHCEGKYAWGRGSGSFTLTPNPDFVAQLNRMGFASPDEDDLYFMTLSDVNLDYIRAIQESGLNATLRQVIDMRAHGISAQYVRDVNHAGYSNLVAQDYIELKDHGVESKFLEEIKASGYNMRTADAVELRMHGVQARFMDELKQAGYDLDAGQINELQMHGVNAGLIRQLKFEGVHPSAPDIVQLQMHGVTPEYLRNLKDAGLGNASTDEVIELRQHGVRTELALAAHDLGYRFTPRELVNLTEHGVDSRYLKTLHDSGLQNLTAEKIQQLRMHGVE